MAPVASIVICPNCAKSTSLDQTTCPHCQFNLSMSIQSPIDSFPNCPYCYEDIKDWESAKTGSVLCPHCSKVLDHLVFHDCVSCKEKVPVFISDEENPTYICPNCSSVFSAGTIDLLYKEGSELREFRKNPWAICPNGCGVQEFDDQDSLWGCSSCGVSFPFEELKQPHDIVGACSSCGETTLLQYDGADVFICWSCGSTAQLEDLLIQEVTEVPQWTGPKTGCFHCGTEVPAECLNALSYDCPTCEMMVNPQTSFRKECPDCKTVSNLFLGWEKTSEEQWFFCLNCQKTIKVPPEVCPRCKRRIAGIAPSSTLGGLYRCAHCRNEFMPKARGTTGLSLYDDDDYDGWLGQYANNYGRHYGTRSKEWPYLLKKLRKGYFVFEELA